MRRSWLLLLGFGLLQSCGALYESVEVPLEPVPADVPPEGPDSDYRRALGRRRDDGTWEWTVQLAVRTLRNPETGVRVRLFALSHVGPSSFYRGLEESLRASDLIVFEGLIGERGDFQKDSDLDWILRAQDSRKVFMGLTSQNDWERKIVDHRWLNVDVSGRAAAVGIAEGTSEIIPRTKELILRTERANREGISPEERARLHSTISAEILSGYLPSGVGPETGASRIQGSRNAAIFGWMKRRLAEGRDKDISMLYGALHAQALEPRFVRDLGFRLETTTWHNLYTLTPGAEEPLAALTRGYLRYLEKDFAGAAEDLKRAIDLDKDYSLADFFLCHVYMALQKFEAALVSIDRYLAAQPKDLSARDSRANVLFQLKRYADAFREIDQLILIAPTATRFHDRGICRLNLNDSTGGVEDLTRAIELASSDPKFWNDRARMYVELKDLAAARADFIKVLELDPLYPEALRQLINLRCRLKEFALAVEDAGRVIAKAPEVAEAWQLRGYVRVLRGEYSLAIADYEKACARASGSVGAWAGLTTAADLAGDLGKARMGCERMLQGNPQDPYGLMCRANLNYQEHRWEEALADYRKVCELTPGDQQAPQGRIWMIRSRKGEQAEATKDLLRYLAGDSTNTLLWKLLAFLVGEFPESKLLPVLNLPESAALPEQKCSIRFYLGTRRLIQGDTEGAKAILRGNRDHAYCGAETHTSSMAELRQLEKP